MGATLAVPPLKQCLAVVIARLRRVAERCRRIAIHHHLAAQHQHVALGGFAKIRIDRLRMHAAIGRGRGRTMPDQLVEEARSDARGVPGITELLLLDEGVGVEPFEQVRRIRADHLHLRHMDVRIDEARQDQVRPVIDHRMMRRRFGVELADHDDLAIAADDDRAVLDVTIARRIIEPLRLRDKAQHPPAEHLHVGRIVRHEPLASRYHCTISARSAGVISLTLPGGMAVENPASIATCSARLAIPASESRRTFLGASKTPSYPGTAEWHCAQRELITSRTAAK